MDFTIITKAGLTQQEFGALVGVSRVTTNTWVRGKMEPHRFIKAQVAAVLRALQKAVKGGDLPLMNVAAKQRAARITDALAAHV
jgi:DNA-binding XRE family transcriptional regulator